jgi:4a-hydroxytetrahydrobiopterin dehydratase
MAARKLKALSVKEVRNRLKALAGWSLSRGALRREFSFANFAKSLQFVNRVGSLAEGADHHPDIDIRYSRVKLALSTHDVGGISEKDFALASAINQESTGESKL